MVCIEKPIAALPAGTTAGRKPHHTGMPNHLLKADGISGLKKIVCTLSVDSWPVNWLSLHLRWEMSCLLFRLREEGIESLRVTGFFFFFFKIFFDVNLL